MKRDMIRGAFWVIGGTIIALCGCERSPTPPPVTSAPSAVPATAPAKPTTQELLTGTYKKIYLSGTPFSVDAPQSWEIKSTGSLNFLEGPAPDDRIMIKVSQFDPITPERFSGMLDRLVKEDLPQPPGTPKKNEVRELGRMRVLERISASDPITTMRLGPRGKPDTDAQGDPIMVTSVPIRWLLSVFVVDGKVVNWYELNCIGMTLDQYGNNNELISKVMSSLRYDDPSLVPALPGTGVNP